MKIPPGGGAMTTIAVALGQPDGMTIDFVGHILVTGYSNSTLSQIDPAGGFFAFPYLPAGLSSRCNKRSAISGTPTAVSASKNYTISAYNSSGGSPAFLNLVVQLLRRQNLAISHSCKHTWQVVQRSLR